AIGNYSQRKTRARGEREQLSQRNLRKIAFPETIFYPEAMDARTLIDAMTLWEGTGTAVAQAAHAVSGFLSDHGIPNLIAGGIAVQLHGYPRTTVDVDIVVPDVQQAHELLLANGYKPSLVRMTAVVDPIRRVTIDLLPSNKCLKPECEVPFPEPKKP